MAAIVAAKARLEAAQREADDARGRRPEWEHHPKGGKPYKRAYGEPDEKAQSNFTDPDSAIMKTSAEGFQQCYNAQVAVDGEHQLIVATELTTNASDQGAMVGLLDEVKDTFDAQPETVLADAGYCNERDLSELEGRGIDGYVAPGRERYAQRKWLSEAPNGWIKEVLGFRRFSVRGLNKARGEWDLVCLALNIKRLQPLLAV